jgi:hypothetical protein
VHRVRDLTVIAIDWSGAKGEGPHSGIWVTAVRNGAVVDDEGCWSRQAAVDYVLDAPPPFVAGFDFSFGLPAWFAHEQGCETIDDVWAQAADLGETWLRPTPPFWKEACPLPVEQRYRRCEERLHSDGHQPKSVFSLVGAGQVGPGSVRGMPHLARLSANGVAICPFDNASDRLAIEIYPSLLRKLFPELAGGQHPTKDAADARVSARVMALRSETFSELTAATDPVTLLEGDVWWPTTSPSALR